MAAAAGKPTACPAPAGRLPIRSSRRRRQSRAGREPRLDSRKRTIPRSPDLSALSSQTVVRLHRYLRTSHPGFDTESPARLTDPSSAAPSTTPRSGTFRLLGLTQRGHNRPHVDGINGLSEPGEPGAAVRKRAVGSARADLAWTGRVLALVEDASPSAIKPSCVLRQETRHAIDTRACLWSPGNAGGSGRGCARAGTPSCAP